MFPYSGNLPDCPGKRTAQKIDIALKICNISCNQRFCLVFFLFFLWGTGAQKYLLTACLNLPVEEEASISRQNTVHTTSTMSANQAGFQRKRGAPQQRELMHETRNMDTGRLPRDKTSGYG